MPAAKDLTGCRFGRLVVLGLDPEPYVSPSGKVTRRWRCQCDCGAQVTVLRSALTSKSGTRSCGCAHKDAIRERAKDMTGARFGRLVVIRKADLEKPTANGNRLGWLCRCDCGNTIITTRKALLSGKVASCGCLLSDTARAKVAQNVMGHYDGTTVSTIRPDRPANRNSKSGIRGVYWSTREQCWIAKITVRRKSITLGRFRGLEAAIAARKKAEEKYFAPIIEEYDNKDT